MEKMIILEENRRLSVFIFIFPDFILCLVHEEQQLCVSTDGPVFYGEGQSEEIDEHCSLKVGYYCESDSCKMPVSWWTTMNQHDQFCLDYGNYSNDGYKEQRDIATEQEMLQVGDLISNQGQAETPGAHSLMSSQRNDFHTDSGGQEIENLNSEEQHNRCSCHEEADSLSGHCIICGQQQCVCAAEYWDILEHGEVGDDLEDHLYIYGEEPLSQDDTFPPPYNVFREWTQELEHCCEKLCCCSQMEHCYNLYCSCGLLKWSCEIHRLEPGSWDEDGYVGEMPLSSYEEPTQDFSGTCGVCNLSPADIDSEQGDVSCGHQDYSSEVANHARHQQQ